MNTFSLAPARAFPTRLGLLLLPYFLPTSCLVPNIYHYTCNTLLLKWELNLSGTEVKWKPNITDKPGCYTLLQVL